MTGMKVDARQLRAATNPAATADSFPPQAADSLTSTCRQTPASLVALHVSVATLISAKTMLFQARRAVMLHTQPEAFFMQRQRLCCHKEAKAHITQPQICLKLPTLS